MTTTCEHLPPCRLRIAAPSDTVLLNGEKNPREVLSVDDHYAYFDRAKISRCHLLDPSCAMFGEGYGWRVKRVSSD